MLRDFVFFLRAFWRQWRILLTGGSIMALVALWGLVVGKSLDGAGWLIVGVTLILAAFLSWRAEWIKAGEEFVKIDLRNIAHNCSGLTNPQAKRLLSHYNGKRMKVTGTLYETSELSVMKPYALISLLHLELNDGGTALIVVSSWNSDFKGLREFPKGTVMTVSGRISAVSYLSGEFASVSLSSCALLHLEFPGASAITPGVPLHPKRDL
jgi:hypothetical protein